MKRTFASVFVVLAMLATSLLPMTAQTTYANAGKYGSSPWAFAGQRLASAFNYRFNSLDALQGGATTFTFPRNMCYLSFGAGKTAAGPSAADTLTITDVVSANTETLAQAAPTVSSGQCVLSPTSAAHTHYNYVATSGTCGIVPAIKDLGTSGTVIVDQSFYDAGCTASTITGTVVAAASKTGIFIHDISYGKDDWYGTPTNATAYAKILSLNKGGLNGITTGTAAAAGTIGEVISNLVPVGSEVSLTTATAAAPLSISLTAGDWDVEASVVYDLGSATTTATSVHEISFNTGTNCSSPAQATDGTEIFLNPPVLTTTSDKFGGSLPMKQFNVSGATTVCVVVTGTFSAGTEKAYGSLIARRRH